MSNTLDTPTRCLRSQQTPKPEQEPSTAPSLVVQEGPRRTHIKLAHVLLQFDLAPREVLPGTAPQRGRDPLLAPQPDLRERHSHDGKITEHWETKRLGGKVRARPAPRPQAGPLLLPKQGKVSLSPWDAGMAVKAARGSCQKPSRGFVACKQLQTSLALPQSQILLGAGKANIGAKVGSRWLCPHEKH